MIHFSSTDTFEKEIIEYKKSKINSINENGILINTYDNTFRSSIESIDKTTFVLPSAVKEALISKYPKVHIPRKWIILKYIKGDFFLKHKDKDIGIRDTIYGKQRHIASILLFPPKKNSQYDGGELIIYNDIDEKVIVADDELWTCVFFELGIIHEVKNIISGERVVLKGFLFENI